MKNGIADIGQAIRTLRGAFGLILLVLGVLAACGKKDEEKPVPAPKQSLAAVEPTAAPTPTVSPTPTPPPVPAPYTTAAGLEVRFEAVGDAPKLVVGDRVLLRYRLLSPEGEVVDEAGQQAERPFEAVVGMGGMEGWDAALLEMMPGSRAHIRIPAELAKDDTALEAEIEVLELLAPDPTTDENP